MINELSKLNAFIGTIQELEHFRTGNPEVATFKLTANQMCTEFGNSLEHRINEQDTTEKLAMFIRNTQVRLTVFSDELYGLIKETGTPATETIEIVKEINTYILGVVNHLHEHFPMHFDHTAKAPFSLLFNNFELTTSQKRIVHFLKENSIEPELVLILEGYFDKLQHADVTRNISWQQYEYQRNLTRQLHRFMEQSVTGNATLKLIKLLMGFNFNPLAFYEFMLGYTERVAGFDTPYEEQVIGLMGLLKVLEDIRPECSDGYNMNVAPIADSVCTSIKRDIERIEKMKEVFMPYRITNITGASTSFYYEVSGTLEEVLFMYRIFMGLHFIKTRFKAHLYAFIERHIKTDRTKTPSPHYMRNIFGDTRTVSPKIVRRVRSQFMMAVSYIDTHFAEQLKF